MASRRSSSPKSGRVRRPIEVQAAELDVASPKTHRHDRVNFARAQEVDVELRLQQIVLRYGVLIDGDRGHEVAHPLARIVDHPDDVAAGVILEIEPRRGRIEADGEPAATMRLHVLAHERSGARAESRREFLKQQRPGLYVQPQVVDALDERAEVGLVHTHRTSRQPLRRRDVYHNSGMWNWLFREGVPRPRLDLDQRRGLDRELLQERRRVFDAAGQRLRIA